MKREIIITDDGSATIHIPAWNEQYHSKHGAIQEANHVFIKNGLHYWIDTFLEYNKPKEISILEIGFGTGLNTLITLQEAEKLDIKVYYAGIEGYPISKDEMRQLNYSTLLENKHSSNYFELIHDVSWEEFHDISDNLTLIKYHKFFSEINDVEKYNLIYFDAFGARVQPELWTAAIFEKMYIALKTNGVLVTYSAKGSVRRALISVGFKVEKLPGPPGKREMLRAIK